MEKMIFIFIIMASFAANSQPGYITEVILAPEKTADQLYTSAMKWISLNINDPQKAIKLNLPTEKKIIFKGNRQFPFIVRKIDAGGRYEFTFICEFRDLRYKYEVEINNVQTGSQSFTYDYFVTLSDYDAMRQYNISQGVTGILLKEKNIKESAENIQFVLSVIESDLSKVIDSFKNSLSKNESKDW